MPKPTSLRKALQPVLDDFLDGIEKVVEEHNELALLSHGNVVRAQVEKSIREALSNGHDVGATTKPTKRKASSKKKKKKKSGKKKVTRKKAGKKKKKSSSPTKGWPKSCLYPKCRDKHKGPRYSFLCEEHYETTPKKKVERLKKKWKEKKAAKKVA